MLSTASPTHVCLVHYGIRGPSLLSWIWKGLSAYAYYEPGSICEPYYNDE